MPIVSVVGSPTVGLSYIWDTQDLLYKLHDLSILCNIDVIAQYPSISHDDGLANLRNALLDNTITILTINGIRDMTEPVHKRNLFEFNKNYFIQTSGNAIGTKLAPGYANLFFSMFERDMLDQNPINPSIWHRYIDDILIIWNESEDKLKDFLAYINTVNPAIQFTHAYSFKSVNFLDVIVSLNDDGAISTDLYTMPTGTH